MCRLHGSALAESQKSEAAAEAEELAGQGAAEARVASRVGRNASRFRHVMPPRPRRRRPSPSTRRSAARRLSLPGR